MAVHARRNPILHSSAKAAGWPPASPWYGECVDHDYVNRMMPEKLKVGLQVLWRTETTPVLRVGRPL